MEQKILHRAATRGNTNVGWLNGYHSFSFGSYYDPTRTAFGALKVLNDDTVQPHTGFATHSHSNMEIISIPLSGSITHKDSTGVEASVKTGEVQIMSAGTGISHSEFNRDPEEDLKFLQIWISPQELNTPPRYQQMTVSADPGKFNQIVSPDQDDDGLLINQQAWLFIADLEKGTQSTYYSRNIDNGVYIFVIEGRIESEGETLERRDAIGLAGEKEISLTAAENSKLLVIEVPL